MAVELARADDVRLVDSELSSSGPEQLPSPPRREIQPFCSRHRYKILLGGLTLSLVVFIAVIVGMGPDTVPPSVPQRAGVATEHFLATQAALDVLARGGNAFDAAAVAQLVLGVVQPQSTGIGGGCVIVAFDAANKTVFALDGREEAYASFSESAFCKDTNCTQAWPFYPERVTGGHSVGVPGVLAATDRILREHGTLTLAEALQPAIEIAENGFPMSAHLHERIVNNVPRLRLFNASAALFLNLGRTAPKAAVGDTFRNPDLAATYRQIAADGSTSFYDGPIADAIVAAARDARNPATGLAGGISRADLRGYRAVKRAAPCVPHGPRGRRVCAHPPPAGGVALLQALRLLGDEPLAAGATEGSVEAEVTAVARLVNAQNVAFADRNKFLADADWVDVPVAGLLDPAYVAGRRSALLDPAGGAAVPAPVPAGAPPNASRAALRAGASGVSPKSSTTHMSVVDKHGNMVAWTTTIEENLGSAVVVPGRGFLLNNELTDFDPLPRDPVTGALRANRPEGGKRPRRTALGEDARSEGGKRPRSSMSPTLVLQDGAPVLAVGSPGGSKIIGTVLNVLARVLNDGTPLAAATAAPRVVSRNDNPALLEQALARRPSVLPALVSRGFNISSDFGPRPLGFVQSVRVGPGGAVEAVADPRLPSAKAGTVP